MTSAPTGSLHRLSDPASGASLEVPSYFERIEGPESIGIVAAVVPWDWPDAFRPNLNLRVDPATPDRCTPDQHATRLVAESLELGLHVAAYDLFPSRAGGHGRRIVSIFPAMGTTIVQLQYAEVRGSSLVTLTAQHDAGKYATGSAIFEHAVASLEVPAGGQEVTPDPGGLPRLDETLRARGEELPDLSGIRSAQRYVPSGPRLRPVDVDALHAGRAPKEETADESAPLRAAGLAGRRGRLTGEGDTLSRLLTRPARTISVDGSYGDRGGSLHCSQSPDLAVIVATRPPDPAVDGFGDTAAVEDDRRLAVDMVPTDSAAVAIARWVGLAPAWTVSLDDDGPSQLPSDTVRARLADPATPVPDGASGQLAELWSQRWFVWSARSSTADGWLMVTTESAGLHRIEYDGPRARLVPVPTEVALRYLLVLAGFEVGARL